MMLGTCKDDDRVPQSCYGETCKTIASWSLKNYCETQWGEVCSFAPDPKRYIKKDCCHSCWNKFWPLGK